MSAEDERVRQALRKFLQKDEPVFTADVIAVDENECTIDVKTAEDAELYGVKLKALQNTKKGVLIIPKNGTTVQVLRIGERDFLMLSADEPEKVFYIIDNVKYEVNANGFVIENGSDSLTDVVDDLFGQVKAVIEELQKVVVVIGVTPNIAALQGISTQLQLNRTKAKRILK